MRTVSDLQNFNGSNRDAVRLAAKASDDYLLARLGIRNHLWSGFEMSTQATEKLLKSYLLFKDSSLGGSAKKAQHAVAARSKVLGRPVERGHDVEAALALAREAGLPCSASLPLRLKRINSYYHRRYPGSGGAKSYGTHDIDDIDEAVFEIWDAFKDVSSDYHYACGIMLPVYGILLHRQVERESFLDRHMFDIMTLGNVAYESRQGDITKEIAARLGTWYCGTEEVG